MMINLCFWRHLHPLVIADENLYAGCNIQHQNIGRIKIYNTYWYSRRAFYSISWRYLMQYISEPRASFGNQRHLATFFDQNHLLALFRCEFMILMIRRGGVKVERGLANDKIILTNKTLSNINSCLMMTDPRIS